MNDLKKEKVVTLRITKKLRQKLSKYSKKTGLTNSQIIRKLLSEKLRNVR